MSGSSTTLLYAFEDFRLDAQHRLLWRGSGAPIPLASKAFDVLLYLVEHPGELLRKRDLLEAIWPDVVVEENNLNQCISALRRTLGERPGEHRFIATDTGRGYRFVASVRTVPAAGATDDSEPSAASRQSPELQGHSAPPVATSSLREAGPSSDRSALEPPRSGHLPRLVVLGVTAVAVAALATMVAYWPREHASQDDSVTGAAAPSAALAVLPFEVVGDDPSRIAAGLHIDLINKLGQMGLTVKARGAVLRYEGSTPDFAAIATEQRVEWILSGSVQQDGDQIRVSVTLVDPAGVVRWTSPQYTVKPEGIFQIQSDIATNVAERLQLELSAATRRPVERRPTGGAQLVYLQALGYAESRRSKALELLNQVIDIDPGFAEAHAQLALLYARSLVDWFADPASTANPEDIYDLVERHARQALSLDETQAAAYAARGEANIYLWHWDEAAKAFADAYRINPRDFDVLVFYSQFNSFRGAFERAIELANDLRRLDANWLYPTWLAYTYAGDDDAASLWLNRQLELDGRQVTAWLNLGFVEARRGHFAEAGTAFETVEAFGDLPLRAAASANLAYGYSRIGLNDEAQRLFDSIESRRNTENIGDSVWVAAYLAIGDLGEASAALARAVAKIERHEPEQAWFSLMILKHNVLGDPKLEESPFKELRARIRG